MTAKIFLLAVWSVIAALLAPPQSGLVSPLLAPDSPSGAGIIHPQWTVWGAEQVALADDGASIWIGGVGSVVQWDKAAGTYRRFSQADGLPQTQVLAIAVDGAGNRWFGGLGGLSRLDKGGAWTHFTTANSGLHKDDIDGLAVVGGDTLYAWHGPADGSVSRLAPDGSWQWFPNRETAIKAGYAEIVARRSSLNAIWTVGGAEVWAGRWVYDGASWHDRPIPSSLPIAGLVADGGGHVWAWSGSYEFYEWDGASWIKHDQPPAFSRRVTSLVADRNGIVWAGLTEAALPYSPGSAMVREASGKNGQYLQQYGPVAALLSTAEGLWAAGPGWLMTPDFKTVVLPDMPRYQDVWDAMVSPSGLLWLTSRPQPENWSGAVQTFDDRGTLPLEDDAWRDLSGDFRYTCARATAFERFQSDVWVATWCYTRGVAPANLVRYRNGERIGYELPSRVHGVLTDIFALDESHIWFAELAGDSGGPDHIVSLDDSGTPFDQSDDQWQVIEVKARGDHMTVAVDAQGRLWRGQADGLYRYDGAGWEQVYNEKAVCDLVPATDGTVFAQLEYGKGEGCEFASDQIIVVSPNGETGWEETAWLFNNDKDRAVALTASRRNSLWAVGADAAAWFIDRGYPQDVLARVSRSGEFRYFALPVTAVQIRRLEVDGRGRVWLVGDGKLWQMEGPAINRLYLPLLNR